MSRLRQDNGGLTGSIGSLRTMHGIKWNPAHLSEFLVSLHFGQHTFSIMNNL